MKSGDIFEFNLGGDIPLMIKELRARDIRFDEYSLEILGNTPVSERRPCRAIVLSIGVFGFDRVADSREVLKRGVNMGYKLCHPETALHIRSLLGPTEEDLHINIAMKGVFVRESELSVLSLYNNDQSEEVGEKEMTFEVTVEPLAWGGSPNKQENAKTLSEVLWVFEMT